MGLPEWVNCLAGVNGNSTKQILGAEPFCGSSEIGGGGSKEGVLRGQKGSIPDPRVQVAVCNTRIIELLQREKKNPYHPGDNIMVDRELGAEEFPIGGRFQIGEVTLEVTDVYNDACAKFASEFGNDVLKWINVPDYHDLNLRGIYCRVIEGGCIRLGDELKL